MLRKQIRKTLLLAVCLFCTGTLAGCKDDTFGDWSDSCDGVKISYTIDDMTDEDGNQAPASRGFKDDSGADLLESVQFIFFNTDGTYVTTSSTATGTQPAENNFSIALPSGVVANKQYKTLIVGNAANFVPTGFNNNFKTYVESIKGTDGKVARYDEMRSRLLVAGKTSKTAQPLAGEWIDGSGKEVPFIFTTDDAGKQVLNGSVRFHRTVCKLNITNNATGLVIKRIAVCNAALATPVFYADGTAAQASTQNYRYSTVPDLVTADWVTVTNGAAGTTVNNAFYIFPNFAAGPARGDRSTTCLLIEATNNGAAAKYYRFNITNQNTTQNLQPNRAYNIKISGVIGNGFATPTEAWLADDVLIYTVKTGTLQANGSYLIDGFDPRPIKCGTYTPDANDKPVSVANGITKSPIAIDVAVTDNTKYTVDVETTFAAIDAELSTAAQAVTNTSGKLPGVVSSTKAKSTFYLQIHRTGPGDGNISKVVTLVAKNLSGQEVQRVSIPIVVTSGCTHGDVILKREKFDAIRTTDIPSGYQYALIADRNSEVPRYTSTGAVSAITRARLENKLITAPNITDLGPSHICVCGGGIPNVDSWLKGTQYYQSAKDPDYYSTNLEQWRKTLPQTIVNTAIHWDFNTYSSGHPANTVLDKNFIISKDCQMIISDYKHNGKYVATWLSKDFLFYVHNLPNEQDPNCHHGGYAYIDINRNYYAPYRFVTNMSFGYISHNYDINRSQFFRYIWSTSKTSCSHMAGQWFVGGNRHWRPLTTAELKAAQTKIGTLTDRVTGAAIP